MLIFKFLSVGVLGAGLSCLVKLYVLDKRHDNETIELLSIGIMTLAIKNYIFKILGVWDTFIFVDFETVTSWLCFGFGYSGMMYALMGAVARKDESHIEDRDVAAPERAMSLEFSHTVVLVCLFVTNCLLIMSTFMYLI